MAYGRKRFGRRRSGFRFSGPKPQVAWLRGDGASVDLSGSATESAAVVLFKASDVISGQALLDHNRKVILKRLLIVLACKFVQGAANELVRIVWGLYKGTVDSNGGDFPLYDPVFRSAGSAEERRADWMWRDTLSIAPAVGTYSLDVLAGAQEHLRCDVKANRGLEANEALIVSVGFVKDATTAVNPGSSLKAICNWQVLLGGQGVM